MFELLYSHTGYVYIYSHHVRLVCESFGVPLSHWSHLYLILYDCYELPCRSPHLNQARLLCGPAIPNICFFNVSLFINKFISVHRNNPDTVNICAFGYDHTVHIGI